MLNTDSVFSLSDTSAGMHDQHQKDVSLITSNPLPGEMALQLIINNLDDIFFLIDKELKVVICSEVAKEMAKKYLDFVIGPGMSILNMVPLARRPFVEQVYREVLNGKEQWTEIEVPLKGMVHYFESYFKPAKNNNKEIIGVAVTTRDITAKKLADKEQIEIKESLRFSEQQYRTLFDSNPLPCWIYDFETKRFLEVNEAAIKHYGYTREEFLQSTIYIIQAEENIEKLKNSSYNRVQKTYSLNNWKHRIKDGRIIFVDLRINSINYHGKAANLVVAHDVTPKVVTENELRKSNERFRLAAKASSEALWEWDVITKEAYISSTYTDMMGWKADEFRKFDEWYDYIHPDDQEETIDSYQRAIDDPNTERWEYEYRYLKSDGSYAYVNDKAVIVRDEKGNAIKVTGALQDITEKKRIEGELKKSNVRFQLASRAASDAIYEWDILADELYWSDSLQSLFGYQPSEVTMEAWKQLLHDSEREKVIQSLEDILAHPRKKLWNQEYRLRRSDGKFSYVLERGFIVRDSAGKALRMIGSLQDISERKFHEQLLSLERSILELSANPDIELREVVNTLLKGIEEIHTDSIASVMLLKNDRFTEHLAAPSLPPEYGAAMSGKPIGPADGSCGTAMYLKKPVITPDIAKDPIWAIYKNIAARFGLKACWSLPIIHSSGKVLGSFAIYHKTVQTPGNNELATVERLRNILRIIMENRWSLQEIRLANERFDIMMKATHDLIWDWDLETNLVYRDPLGLKKVFGTNDNMGIEKISNWMKRLHPGDTKKVKKVISRILKAVDENNFEVEYRFRRDDGSYSYVYDRGIIIRNSEGKPIRMIGAAQDVSERKRLEKELLNNELEHQKAINQATIETQEQERSEIGKELHDNVNQVLTTTKLYLDLAQSNPELKDEMVVKANKNIINVINEIRQLSRSLMNPSIGDLGLIDSINDLIENINLTRKLHVSLQAKAEIEDLLDKNQKLTIFRIIQEALNNAIKHAKASRVTIKILYNASLVEVVIEDNGIGFNIQKVKKGAGLKNIQNRIYLINGTHNIESAPSKGSKIIINFPFKQNSIS
jgi:PAS domain S-box-containing protein